MSQAMNACVFSLYVGKKRESLTLVHYHQGIEEKKLLSRFLALFSEIVPERAVIKDKLLAAVLELLLCR